MNVIQKGIVALVCSAVTGKKMTLPEAFTLTDAENLIVKHQIVGLAYEGAVQCGIPASDPTMRRLFQRYCQITFRSNGQMQAVAKMMAVFEENGIDYLPVKGYLMKQLYPKPEMRVMTDADVLVRMAQYDRIRPLMESLGYTEGIVDDHALVWDGKEIEIELHRRLVPSDEETYSYIGDGWSRAVCRQGHRYDLQAEDHYIYLFAHLVKHYRRGGIGLRQVVDLWVFARKHPELDQTYLKEQLRQQHLETFHDNILKLLAFWFEDAAADEKTEFISQFIFDSGSWGTTEQRIIFEGYKHAKHAKSAKAGHKRMVIWILFPNALEMSDRYPVLRKAPWLLPVFWPIRWVTAVLFRRKNVRAVRRKAEFITEERVDSFAQALEYVGLS